LRQCCRQRTLLVRLLLETRDVAAAVQWRMAWLL